MSCYLKQCTLNIYIYIYLLRKKNKTPVCVDEYHKFIFIEVELLSQNVISLNVLEDGQAILQKEKRRKEPAQV